MQFDSTKDDDSNCKKLRFDFHDEWINTTIGKVATVVSGGTPSTKIPQYWEGDINWYTPSEIGKNKYVFSSKRKISKEGLDNSSAKLLPKNTILLSSRATIGETSISMNESTTNQGFQSLIVNSDVDLNFIYYLIESNKRNLLKKATGSTFREISSKEIKKLEIKIPTLNEQKKIGTMLSSVDQKIELIKQQLNQTTKFKQFLLQHLFANKSSESNELHKLRFENENGEDFSKWKYYNIEDLIDEISEKSTINNQYDILSSTREGIVLQDDYFNRDIASKDNTGYKILRKNQLVLSPQNLWLGNININFDFEIGLVSPSYKVYNINEDILLVNFLNCIIKTPRMVYEYKCASEQGASVVRRNLNKKLFNKIKIKIPSIEEQEKIASFLSSVDQKIDLINQQLNQTTKFKKYLLQHLFINITHQYISY